MHFAILYKVSFVWVCRGEEPLQRLVDFLLLNRYVLWGLLEWLNDEGG